MTTNRNSRRRLIIAASVLIALAVVANLFNSSPHTQSSRTAFAQSGEKQQATAPEKQTVQLQLTGQDKTEPQLGYGNCQWLYPHNTPQEKLADKPDLKSEKPVYYAGVFGDAADTVYTFVLDESKGAGKGYDVVYVDVNNDNRINAELERFELKLSTVVLDQPLRIHILVSAGGTTRRYYVNFTAFPYKDDKHPIEQVHANLRNSSYFSGEAELFGRKRLIAIADLDTNGLFNDVEQGLFHGDRVFVDMDESGRIASNDNVKEGFPYGGYTLIRDRWFTFVSSPDGSRMEIAEADPPLGHVTTQSRINAATLLSDKQPQYLDFNEGRAAAVAGTYLVKSVKLLAQYEPDSKWGLQGSFADKLKTITILEGETSRLDAGMPLTVEAVAVPTAADGAVQFSLLITGIGGERYRWRQRTSSSPKAGFVIVGSDGQEITAQEFEYG